MIYTKYDIFLKTLALGSMTKAAEHFGYTQSAVSQMLNSMEKELGVILLVRGRCAISLTTEGEQLLPYIRDICDSSFALSEKVMELKGICSGLIRIGSFHSIACYILSPLIKGFQELYPGVEFELAEGDFTEIENSLRNGQIDVGFLAVQNIKEFDVIELKKDRLNVILPPNHPRAKEKLYNLEEIPKESFIYLDEGNDNDSQIVFKATGIVPNIKYYSKEDNTILSMVESGLGVAILPELVTSRCPFDVTVKEMEPAFYRTLGAVVKDRKKASNAVRRFLEYVTESYK